MTVPVSLAVQAITSTWTVVPTAIQDQYDVALRLTYEVDTPAPAAVVDPPLFEFTRDDANRDGPLLLNGSSATQGDLTIYNPSRVALTNVVVDVSGVSPNTMLLTYNGAIGKSITIPTLAGQTHLKVHYDTGSPTCAGIPSGFVGISGQYTYFKSVPTLSLSENAFSYSITTGIGSSKQLTISNSGYGVASNVHVSTAQHPWITTTRSLGDLGLANVVPFRILVDAPTSLAPGTYSDSLTVSAGGRTPDGTLALTAKINADGSGSVQGVFTPGAAPPSTGASANRILVRGTCDAISLPGFSVKENGDGVSRSILRTPTVRPCGPRRQSFHQHRPAAAHTKSSNWRFRKRPASSDRPSMPPSPRLIRPGQTCRASAWRSR